MSLKPNRQQIEKAARALYKFAGWDRPWRKIDPSGRRRWREAVKIVAKTLTER